MLADFRAWLGEAGNLGDAPADASSEPPLDLHTLLSQFTALRHEVNLQTKAVRAQQEQNAATLEQLGRAVEALQTSSEPADAAGDEELRPLLKTLVDARDALALARREVERVQDSVRAALDQLAASPVRSPGFLERLFGRDAARPAVQDEPARPAAATAERVRQSFDSILTGYTMSLQRLERALAQSGLEPIFSLGEPFDPELMEVVEVATDSDRPAHEVVEEVRRGYLWRGRVFRYAQVRVSKPV